MQFPPMGWAALSVFATSPSAIAVPAFAGALPPHPWLQSPSGKHRRGIARSIRSDKGLT